MTLRLSAGTALGAALSAAAAAAVLTGVTAPVTLTAASAPLTAVVHSNPPPPKKCGPGYVSGTIGGQQKCLQVGQQCQQAHVPDYTHFGFTCVKSGNVWQLRKPGPAGPPPRRPGPPPPPPHRPGPPPPPPHKPGPPPPAHH